MNTPRDKRGFRRTMNLIRPFDCWTRGCEWGKETCKPGSGRSHGRSGMKVFIAVEKDDFALSLEWLLPVYHDETPDQARRVGFRSDDPLFRGLGEVSYHQPHRPEWDDNKTLGEHYCMLLEGGKCFSDGSSIRAGEIWDEWMAKRQPDSDLYELLEDEWEKWKDQS